MNITFRIDRSLHSVKGDKISCDVIFDENLIRAIYCFSLRIDRLFDDTKNPGSQKPSLSW